MKKSFASYLRFQKLLEENKVSIYKVAKDTGIAPTTLYEWGYGRSIPKANKLKKVADYFGVSIEYFLEESERDAS